VLAGDDLHDHADRADLQVEMNQLACELDRIATSTEFNGHRPLTGRYATGLHLPIGAQPLTVAIPAMTADALNLTGGRGGGLAIGFKAQARQAVSVIDSAVHAVTRQQAELREAISRLHLVVTRLRIEADGAGARKRRITNLDMASAVTHVLRAQILREPKAAVTAHTKLSRGLLLRFPPRKSSR
ncbi:MAG: flagellin, partial [Candidatus Sericytochromatia bacterium]